MGQPINRLAAWAFPWRKGARGYFGLAYDRDVIKQNVEQILGTRLGERRMQPLFGCEIYDTQWEPADDTTMARAGDSIRKALRLWEPRVSVLEVRADPPTVTNLSNVVLYQVNYRIIATGQQDFVVGELPTRR